MTPRPSTTSAAKLMRSTRPIGTRPGGRDLVAEAESHAGIVAPMLAKDTGQPN
jgi:hypothetical protein